MVLRRRGTGCQSRTARHRHVPDGGRRAGGARSGRDTDRLDRKAVGRASCRIFCDFRGRTQRAAGADARRADGRSCRRRRPPLGDPRPRARRGAGWPVGRDLGALRSGSRATRRLGRSRWPRSAVPRRPSRDLHPLLRRRCNAGTPRRRQACARPFCTILKRDGEDVKISSTIRTNPDGGIGRHLVRERRRNLRPLPA